MTPEQEASEHQSVERQSVAGRLPPPDKWVASGVGGDYDNPDVLAAAFRAAAKRLHPDPQGGDADGAEFVRLTVVRRLLADAGARKSA